MNSLPRIILIPGWAHESTAMEDLRIHLESFADVCPVSCGNLWSAETATGAPSSYAQNLGKMIEKTGARAFVAGWSLGGMIALETACHWPELVAGVILIGSTPRFCAGNDWQMGTPPGAVRAMIRGLKRDFRGVLRAFLKNAAWPFEENEKTVMAGIEQACSMNMLELVYGLDYLCNSDLRSKLPGLRIPALILHGRQDAVINVEAAVRLKRLLALSRIRVYDQFGHGLPFQNAPEVAGDIIGFVKECRACRIKTDA